MCRGLPVQTEDNPVGGSGDLRAGLGLFVAVTQDRKLLTHGGMLAEAPA